MTYILPHLNLSKISNFLRHPTYVRAGQTKSEDLFSGGQKTNTYPPKDLGMRWREIELPKCHVEVVKLGLPLASGIFET